MEIHLAKLVMLVIAAGFLCGPVAFAASPAAPLTPSNSNEDRSPEASDLSARAGQWKKQEAIPTPWGLYDVDMISASEGWAVTHPITGDHAMPTMGTFIQLLPKSFKTGLYRSTDATVYVAMEGRGRTRVGEQSFDWGPKDIFVAPSWKPVTHEADEEAVLFSFSDRPVQEKIGVWREDRGNA